MATQTTMDPSREMTVRVLGPIVNVWHFGDGDNSHMVPMAALPAAQEQQISYAGFSARGQTRTSKIKR